MSLFQLKHGQAAACIFNGCNDEHGVTLVIQAYDTEANNTRRWFISTNRAALNSITLDGDALERPSDGIAFIPITIAATGAIVNNLQAPPLVIPNCRKPLYAVFFDLSEPPPAGQGLNPFILAVENMG